MKRIVFRIGLCLLFALATGWTFAEMKEHAMKSSAFAAERPPIDRAIPAKMETATFAMG